MAQKKIIGEALTYDDVLLVPAKSSVLPRETIVKTRLSRHIELNIPLISAAMDTVTESEMAVALAREGGIGILHKNMPIRRQAEEVDRVKRSESGMIQHPVTMNQHSTVREAMETMRKYSISGIPIVEDDKLVGILTNRDLRFEPNLDLPVSKIMTSENLISAPAGTTLEEAEVILQKHRIEKLPILDKAGKLKGLITFKDIQKKKRYPHACKDKMGRLRVGAAVGVTFDTLERVQALIDAGVDVVIIDTAHGHSVGVLNMIRKVKAKFDVELIAGNVATAEATRVMGSCGSGSTRLRPARAEADNPPADVGERPVRDAVALGLDQHGFAGHSGAGAQRLRHACRLPAGQRRRAGSHAQHRRRHAALPPAAWSSASSPKSCRVTAE